MPTRYFGNQDKLIINLIQKKKDARIFSKFLEKKTTNKQKTMVTAARPANMKTFPVVNLAMAYDYTNGPIKHQIKDMRIKYNNTRHIYLTIYKC